MYTQREENILFFTFFTQIFYINGFEPISMLRSSGHMFHKLYYTKVNYDLKRVSFGSKDCTKELKIECAYFLGQTS